MQMSNTPPPSMHSLSSLSFLLSGSEAALHSLSFLNSPLSTQLLVLLMLDLHSNLYGQKRSDG